LPFVLAWLLCLLVFMADERPMWLYAAASFLGLGFFSYIGSVVMMPMYFAITCAAALQHRLSSPHRPTSSKRAQ
jgi:hypothetical protein